MTHAQANTKRLEMSTKTPGRQQTNLGKEVQLENFAVLFIGLFLFCLFRVKLKQQHHFDQLVLFINVKLTDRE
jgi:hypothetical protein